MSCRLGSRLEVELRDDGRAAVIEERSVVGPSGKRLDRAFAFGVGDQAFFFHDRQVLALRDW